MACVLSGCNSSRKKKYDEDGVLISLHRIPKSDTPLGEKWLNFIRHCENDSNWVPKRGAMLCAKHFLADSLYKNFDDNRTYLKDDAVPTVMCVSPESSKNTKRRVKPKNKLEDENECVSSESSKNTKRTVKRKRNLEDENECVSSKPSKNTKRRVKPKRKPEDGNKVRNKMVPNVMVVTSEHTDISSQNSILDDGNGSAMEASPESDEEESSLLKPSGIFKNIVLYNESTGLSSQTVPSSNADSESDCSDSNPDCAIYKPASVNFSSYDDLVKFRKLESTVARLQKLTHNRLKANRALKSRNRRLKVKNEFLNANLENYQQNITKNNSKLDLADKPLVKQFLAAQKLFNGRRLNVIRC